MKPSLLTILSLLIILAHPHHSHSATCNPEDKKVLLKIKQAFNNPYHLSSWNPDTDCCTWYVVECDYKTGRINSLHLYAAANVSGQIPADLAELPYLESLTFHKTANLTGMIPPAIARLTHLRTLRISWTNISGPIPSFLTNLTNLMILDLSFNNFSGSIPASLAGLRNLLGMRLDRNRLTGSIPKSFGELSPTVQYLYLSHNQISGTVPRALGDLNFTVIELQRNQLEGDISFLFGKNKTVEIVNFSRNKLQFDLSKVEFPDSLTSLDLNHNGITGSLPEGLTRLNLLYLNVSYNRLCGKIPTGGMLQRMDYTSYFHNRCLCSIPLPASMKTALLSILSLLILLTEPYYSHSARCNPEDKKALLRIKQAFNNPYHLASWNPDTDCCTWYVVECNDKTGRINNFHLFSANISGQIPPAMAELPYLESLTFHKITNLTGRIPPAIARLTYLRSLRISWTNLSGPIPSFLSELKNLTFLDLSFNNFSGSIPAALSKLRNLDGMRLDRNRLTGSIPGSFGALSPSVQYLYLSHNQISGTVPRAWGDLNFTWIELQRNQLEGDISFLFGKNKTISIADFSRNILQFDLSNVEFPDSLSTLDLNHNRITGRLPEGLTKLDSLFLNVSYNRLCGQIPVGGALQKLEYTSYFHNKCLCGAPLPECK